MIRRDYILRMLAEFFEVLSRIRALKKGQKWEEASLAGDQEFQRLISGGAQLALKLSETELLARLINGESTLAVRDKTLMLTSLLKEEGDIAAGQGRHLDSRACYLKGLHLLLGVLINENIDELPEFVPRVDAFLIAMADSPLPMGTYAMLMRHYELAGEFGKAEDALFSMVEEEPDNLGLLDFGIGFYQRLQAKTDDALLTGNLPRVELEASLEQLLARKKTELARTSTAVQ